MNNVINTGIEKSVSFDVAMEYFLAASEQLEQMRNQQGLSDEYIVEFIKNIGLYVEVGRCLNMTLALSLERKAISAADNNSGLLKQAINKVLNECSTAQITAAGNSFLKGNCETLDETNMMKCLFMATTTVAIYKNIISDIKNCYTDLQLKEIYNYGTKLMPSYLEGIHNYSIKLTNRAFELR